MSYNFTLELLRKYEIPCDYSTNTTNLKLSVVDQINLLYFPHKVDMKTQLYIADKLGLPELIGYIFERIRKEKAY